MLDFKVMESESRKRGPRENYQFDKINLFAWRNGLVSSSKALCRIMGWILAIFFEGFQFYGKGRRLRVGLRVGIGRRLRVGLRVGIGRRLRAGLRREPGGGSVSGGLEPA
jgi:hypothetical protein